MNEELTVTFDGKVFHPQCEHLPKFEKNARYIISIIREEKVNKNAWDILEEIAGTITGPKDWSEEHEHYLYGTPKNNIEND